MAELINKEETLDFQINKKALDSVRHKWLDYSCTTDCDPEYCESILTAVKGLKKYGCSKIDNCPAYKEAKERLIKK